MILGHNDDWQLATCYSLHERGLHEKAKRKLFQYNPKTSKLIYSNNETHKDENLKCRINIQSKNQFRLFIHSSLERVNTKRVEQHGTVGN